MAKCYHEGLAGSSEKDSGLLMENIGGISKLEIDRFKTLKMMLPWWTGRKRFGADLLNWGRMWAAEEWSRGMK